MYIFLDDERSPANVTWIQLPDITRCMWKVVRSYDEFVSLLSKVDDIKFVSFDHDLADEHYGQVCNGDAIDYSKFKERTGMDCARALTNWCMNNGKKLPGYTVHSMNPVGKENIISLLESFKKQN